MPRRIHILGASGTGTSTLARGLASALGSQAFDTDDFFWLPTDPPFTDKRPAADRLALMRTVFLPRSDWVLSGSMTGWGDPVIPRLTHVVFLTMAAGPRLARLRRRERQRNGALIAPGGPRAGAYRGFLDWAMAYDDPDFTGRSRRRHEAWLDALTCPVIRLDAAGPAEALLAAALAALERPGAKA
ncbi:MAG: adenylate kinase [Rhodobacter sp.]|nr:adenylate kinase [Rhodobacter sp.]